MKWQDWRKICTERGLSKEQTSDSWSEYKELIRIVEEGTLKGIVALGIRSNKSVTDSQLDELNNLSKSINDAIGDFEPNNPEDTIDENMFMDMENTHNKMMHILEDVNNKIEYYENRAQILRHESNITISDMSNDLRKYKI